MPPPPCAIVSVTPDGIAGQDRVEFSTGHSETFWVQNIGGASGSFSLSCWGTNGITCTGTNPSTVSLAAGEQKTVTVNYNVGAPGSAQLWLRASGETEDTGYYVIAVIALPPPVIALRYHNNDNRDRSLCLTSGAGEAAAWQCGDLLVSHSMPGYTTMGRERSLTLLYNSAQATPRPVVVASVVQASGSTPSAVAAELKVNGVVRASASYTGWGTAPLVRQIALSYDAAGDAAGIYPFDLIVTNQYTSSSKADTASGELLVVNRSSSEFGSGWWLAGVEQLIPGQPNGRILWVGGDGSAKVYTSVGADTWVGAPGAYRDTLRYDSGTLTYTRTLRHEIQVNYDATGRHIETVNRVGQRTRFFWNATTGRLDSIAVSPQNSDGSNMAGTVYRLAYDANAKLDRMTDPAGRVLDATVSGGRLTSLTDPDNYSTGFGYDAAARMTQRTTRRNYTTHFTYAKALRVTQVKVPLDPSRGDTAVTVFDPWDEKGLATGSTGQTAVDTALAYTKIFGPRVNVADDATFWVDRWGAPTKIVNPIGATTTLVRGDAAVPALVTQLTYPDGGIVKLGYNARGNLLQQRDSTWHLADSVRLPTAAGRWTYNAPNTQDSPDSLVDSTASGALVTRFAYSTLGLTDSVIEPNGHVTKFQYATGSSDPLRGAMKAVVGRAVPVWNDASLSKVTQDLRTAFALNALGNVIADTSPLGLVRQFGRDGAQRVSGITDPAGHVVELSYDSLNRVRTFKRVIEGGVQLVARQTFAIDLPDSVIDPRSVIRRFDYDAANRGVREFDEFGRFDQQYYNAGSLVDSVRSRFFQDSAGRAIRLTYDPAGRLTEMSWPARPSVLPDTVRFTYDVMDQVLTAVSGSRRITRTYYANGALRSEVQAASDGGSSYTNFYAYDRVGRRTFYRIGTGGSSDSVWYSYAPGSGELRVVGVRWRTGVSDSVQFFWDALGRRDSLRYTNGTTLRLAYDGDGRFRLLCAQHPDQTAGSFDVFDVTVYAESLNTDGLVTKLVRPDTASGISGCGANQTEDWVYRNNYDARHQLVGQDGVSISEGFEFGRSQAFAYDSSGNMIQLQSEPGEDLIFVIADSSNRMNRVDYPESEPERAWRHDIRYEAEGARLTDSAGCNTCSPSDSNRYLRRFYYDGLGRTTGVRTRLVDLFEQVVWVGSTNLCQYDPFGRLYGPCEVFGGKLGFDGETVTRTGHDGQSAWTFVHGPGTDDPLMGYYDPAGHYVYFVTDGAGRQYAVGQPAGWDYSDHHNYVNVGGKYAGGITNAHTFDQSRHASDDAPNLAFFRNRFYDQTNGRWTQEDPLGLAAGMNLYGFVGNNPVTFTDPFGLWECPDPNDPKCPKPVPLPPVDVEEEFDPWGGKPLFGEEDPVSLGPGVDWAACGAQAAIALVSLAGDVTLAWAGVKVLAWGVRAVAHGGVARTTATYMRGLTPQAAEFMGTVTAQEIRNSNASLALAGIQGTAAAGARLEATAGGMSHVIAAQNTSWKDFVPVLGTGRAIVRAHHACTGR